MIIGQSGAPEILAFDLATDGKLSNRRVYVRLPEGCVTDGMCVDREGGVWAASPITNEFIYVTAAGQVTHRVSTGRRHAIACMLGSEDRCTLFCMTAAGVNLSVPSTQLQGRIETLAVDIPGAGLP